MLHTRRQRRMFDTRRYVNAQVDRAMKEAILASEKRKAQR